jgi:hypothetical protein
MSSFTPLIQTSKLVHKGMGVSRCQNVNNYQCFIRRRFYNAKVKGIKIQDINPFWPYEHYLLVAIAYTFALWNPSLRHFSFCPFALLHNALLYYALLH